MYSIGSCVKTLSCGVAILDLRLTTKKSSNTFRGSNKGHPCHVKFPLNVFLSRRIMKFQPLGKHNWPIGHLKFTNDMIITNDVEDHSSKISPKFGKVLTDMDNNRWKVIIMPNMDLS